jgi:hypothetical protein
MSVTNTDTINNTISYSNTDTDTNYFSITTGIWYMLLGME